MKEQEWTYVDEYRRYKNDTHHISQLYLNGKWIEIDTDMTPIKSNT